MQIVLQYKNAVHELPTTAIMDLQNFGYEWNNGKSLVHLWLLCSTFEVIKRRTLFLSVTFEVLLRTEA